MIECDFSWHSQWDNYVKSHYAKASDKHKTLGVSTIKLHRYILGINHPEIVVDHLNHNTLDNRRCNLIPKSRSGNSINRKGANTNNETTGIRNISYIEHLDKYWVQFCLNGSRYKWSFDSFDEAVNFANVKRVELFGE